jgi:hypothetical protein
VAGLLTDAQLLRRFIDELHRNPHGPQLYQQRIIEYLAGEQRLGRLPAVDLEAATTLFTGGTLMPPLPRLARRPRASSRCTSKTPSGSFLTGSSTLRTGVWVASRRKAQRGSSRTVIRGGNR